jgi:hypothetical protein
MSASRRVRLVAALCAAAALAAPATAAAAPNPFLHDVDRINGHLRVAIEYAPEELGEALGTAQVVCGLGERAASRGESDAAAADWATLTQLVDEVGVAAERHVQSAFANADSMLQSLRERYEGHWAADDPRLGHLRHGVATTRLGIRFMRRAIGGFDKPFASWRAHECAAANTGVDKAFRHIPTGLRLVDLGMIELWRLAGLLPEAAPRA